MVNIKKTVSNNNETVVLKKRGRKSKKELELAQQKQALEMQNNINIIIEESENNKEQHVFNDLLNNDKLLGSANTQVNNTNTNTNTNFLLFTQENDNDNDNDNDNEKTDEKPDEKPLPKKRGRKPKGGKIIQQSLFIDNNKETKPNVILHLKCSLKDLQTNTLLENNIESFNFSNTAQLSFDVINDNKKLEKNIIQPNIVEEEADDDDDDDDNNNKLTKDNNIRDIWKKLKILQHNLHINNICDKKSACFWCTYDFDNPPVYIPKHFIKDAYDVYGCFCSPECATAYLMEEHIDSSSKFERYYLMNNIYAKIYNFTKNIKPAPDPYYMLDKYYGNLSIQEYRSLLRNERLFLVVDKPLTRVFPELHEDNDDFIINNKIIPSNAYQIKKKLPKKQTKNNILSERFGLNQ
jgi:hypothetical protein